MFNRSGNLYMHSKLFFPFLQKSSLIKEEKLMKFLTGSCRIPVLGTPRSTEVNFKQDCKWMQIFSHGLNMFFYIRVTSPYSE